VGRTGTERCQAADDCGHERSHGSLAASRRRTVTRADGERTRGCRIPPPFRTTPGAQTMYHDRCARGNTLNTACIERGNKENGGEEGCNVSVTQIVLSRSVRLTTIRQRKTEG
jgi:hypothetical protein